MKKKNAIFVAKIDQASGNCRVGGVTWENFNEYVLRNIPIAPFSSRTFSLYVADQWFEVLVKVKNKQAPW